MGLFDKDLFNLDKIKEATNKNLDIARKGFNDLTEKIKKKEVEVREFINQNIKSGVNPDIKHDTPEKEILSLKKELKKKNAELSEYVKKFAYVEELLKRREEIILSLHKTIDELNKSGITGLEKNNIIKTLNLQLQEREKTIDRMSETVIEKNTLINNLQIELRESREDTAQKQREIDKAQAIINKRDETINSLIEDLQEMKQRALEIEKLLASTQK